MNNMSFRGEINQKYLNFEYCMMDSPSKEDDWLAFSPTKCLGAVVCTIPSKNTFHINIYYGPVNTPSQMITTVFPKHLPDKIWFKTDYILKTKTQGFITETIDLESIVLPYIVFES